MFKMNLIENYDDFKNEKFINESLSFNEKIEKFKKIKERSNIRFGVIVATYQREDKTTLEKLTEAIESIRAQTYGNYKIYLMGDDYENEEELKPLIESFDSSKLLFENLGLPGERLRFQGHDRWHSGSNTVANMAINKAIRDGLTHMVRLDHDDVWTENHLKYLAKAITRYPKAKMFSTTSLIKRYKTGSDNYARPQFRSVPHIGYNNLKHVTEIWHSALCWDLKEFKDLRYRNVREQKLTEPVRPDLRGGDRDMIQRLTLHMVKKNVKWVHVPLITLLYRNKKGELPTLV